MSTSPTAIETAQAVAEPTPASVPKEKKQISAAKSAGLVKAREQRAKNLEAKKIAKQKELEDGLKQKPKEDVQEDLEEDSEDDLEKGGTFYYKAPKDQLKKEKKKKEKQQLKDAVQELSKWMIEMKARKERKKEGKSKQPISKILKPNQKAEHFKKEINKSILFDVI